MGNLIKANLLSIKSNRIVLIGFLAFLIFCIMDSNITYGGIDNAYFGLSIISGVGFTVVFVVGCFVPFMVGMDFDGGMIRNKIMAGHSKTKIYLSNLISSLLVTVILTAIIFAFKVATVASSVGSKRFTRWFQNQQVVNYFIQITIWVFAICVVYTAISLALIMISENKAIALVGLISIALVFSITNGTLRRYATDTVKTTFEINEKNELVEIPNPYYIAPDDPMKKVYITMDSIDVIGQIITPPEEEVYDENNAYDMGHSELPVRYDIGCIFMAILVTGLGVIIFNRRNLK